MDFNIAVRADGMPAQPVGMHQGDRVWKPRETARFVTRAPIIRQRQRHVSGEARETRSFEVSSSFDSTDHPPTRR
jgi:hypothetical protein